MATVYTGEKPCWRLAYLVSDLEFTANESVQRVVSQEWQQALGATGMLNVFLGIFLPPYVMYNPTEVSLLLYHAWITAL